MIILGIILLIIGFIAHISVLWTIGVILLVIGAILWILGATRSADRRPTPLLVTDCQRTNRMPYPHRGAGTRGRRARCGQLIEVFVPLCIWSDAPSRPPGLHIAERRSAPPASSAPAAQAASTPRPAHGPMGRLCRSRCPGWPGRRCSGRSAAECRCQAGR